MSFRDAKSTGVMQRETRAPRRSVESYILSIFEIPLALMLAYAVMVAVAWAGCRLATNRCVDISGLPWYLGGALLGLVVAVFYWRKAFGLADRLRRRLLLDAIVVVLGVAPFVIASMFDRLAERERAAVRPEPHAPMTR